MPKKNSDTREKILSSAEELFSKKWYETVSVAEICRNANVSNGVAYRYFNNKEEIFITLLEIMLKNFENVLNIINGNNVEERLRDFTGKVLNLGINYKELITIYREGQFRFPDYEKKLRNIYMKSLSIVYKRKISEVEYLYLISGIRFVNIRFVYEFLKDRPENSYNLILNGYFGESAKQWNYVFKEPANYEISIEEKSSRDKLIEAGIELFGSKGFYNVNIYEITALAGYASGTFYIYFKSKEEFLAEIITLIGKKTRKFLTSNIIKSLNGIEQELRGIFLFLKFFEKNKNYYEIVRESEFVIGDYATDYYKRFEMGYLKHMKDTKYEDRKIVANMLMGLSHYIGIEYLFSNNISDPKIFLKEMAYYLENGLKK